MIESLLAKKLDMLGRISGDYEIKKQIANVYRNIINCLDDAGGSITSESIAEIAKELKILSERLPDDCDVTARRIISGILYDLLKHVLEEKADDYSSSSNYYDNYSDYDEYRYNENQESYYNNQENVKYSSDEYKTSREFASKYSPKKHNNTYEHHSSCSTNANTNTTLPKEYSEELIRRTIIKLTNNIAVTAIELVPALVKMFIEKKWKIDGNIKK